MDFKDTLKQIADKIEKSKDFISTEEATKTAFIMPFISALGYDVFNPLEVVPEMDCDLCKTKGEKIDYAIMKEGEPIMLIECKHWASNLNLHETQLQRYYVASKAKFAVLTNGIVYRFYTDLVNTNIMDEKPFLVIDITDAKDNEIEELKKFHKSYFNVQNVLSTASELKYINEIKNLIFKEFTTPSTDFVRYFARKVYPYQLRERVVEQFSEYVVKCINGYINDVIADRLQVALDAPTEKVEEKCAEVVEEVVENKSKVVTTEEEMESYFICKSILRSAVDVNRIYYRDQQSYFSILFDDNCRKTICRMYFNTGNKYISLWDDKGNEVKHKIESLNDIYNYSEDLIEQVKKYLK